jgi:starch phosphorylase
VLTLGFGRRFATYKRATLLFQDLDWLRQIACRDERPVLFLFAGKAHPADEPGQALMRRIVEVARLREFESRILLVEGYDLRLARRLVGGVDVWLNNPVYPLEACGTSGMKAAMNGVVNLSVTDGWWAEGYDGGNGWAIKPASPALDAARRDAEEARTLYELLQDQVVPLYYARNGEGYSPGWVAMAKASMASVAPRFNSMRMLEEYVEKLYRPAAARGARLARDSHAGARALADWGARVRAAWSGVALRRAGEPPARIEHGERVRIAVAARLNGLAPADVAVELVLDGARLRLEPQGALAESGEHLYALEFAPEPSGRIEYRLRAFPCHELLAHPFETGLMTWL